MNKPDKLDAFLRRLLRAPQHPTTKAAAVAFVLRVYVMAACFLSIAVYMTEPGTWTRFVYVGCLVLIAFGIVYVGHWYIRNVVARSLLVAAIARLDAMHQSRQERNP